MKRWLGQDSTPTQPLITELCEPVVAVSQVILRHNRPGPALRGHRGRRLYIDEQDHQLSRSYQKYLQSFWILTNE